MIEEPGPHGTRAFGQGQAANHRWMLQRDRCHPWHEENGIRVSESVTPERVGRPKMGEWLC
jgi:hypothetical protein